MHEIYVLKVLLLCHLVLYTHMSYSYSSTSYLEQSLLTLDAHAQRGLRYLVCVSVCVCLCVCVSVSTYSRTTRNKTAQKRYQLVQCHTGLIYDFRETAWFKSYGVKRERNMNIASPRPLFAALHTVRSYSKVKL